MISLCARACVRTNIKKNNLCTTKYYSDTKINESTLLTKYIYIIQEIIHKDLSIQIRTYDIVNTQCGSTKSCSLINYFDQPTKDSRSPAIQLNYKRVLQKHKFLTSNV